MRNGTTSKIIITVFLILVSLFVLFPIAIVFMNSFKGSLFISNAPFKLPVFEGQGSSFVGLKNYFTGIDKIHFLLILLIHTHLIPKSLKELYI